MIKISLMSSQSESCAGISSQDGSSDRSPILVVDDNANFADVLVRAFRRRGIEAFAAHDGEEALALLQEHEKVDRIVLDLNLGNPVSGLKLIPKLRAGRKKRRIVLLTGYASLATATEAIRLGATHYLAKPSSVDEVLAAFDRLAGEEHLPVERRIMSCAQLEWERLSWALVRHQGNISATARFLRMERRTLQRKLRKHARR